MPTDIEHLRQLPIAEKLRIVEALWDDIWASDEPFPLQQWHRDEIERRIAEFDADPPIGLTEEELWKRVEQLRG